MNLFGLGMDSKIEDVLHEVGCNTRLYNILMYNINLARVHKTIYTCGYVSGKDKVITMRDLVNMSREKILNVRNLGNKGFGGITVSPSQDGVLGVHYTADAEF